jgi:hypothetical protein
MMAPDTPAPVPIHFAAVSAAVLLPFITNCFSGTATDDLHILRRRRGHISRANQRIRPMMLTSSPLPSYGL